MITKWIRISGIATFLLAAPCMAADDYPTARSACSPGVLRAGRSTSCRASSAETLRRARPVDCDRQPRRRGRHHRHAARGAGRTGWLHAALQQQPVRWRP